MKRTIQIAAVALAMAVQGFGQNIYTVLDYIGSSGLAFDPSGNLYGAGGTSVLKLTPKGVYSIVAGQSGQWGDSGDGGPAASAQLKSTRHIAVDTSGSLYIADSGSCRIRKVPVNGTISTVAGTGTCGYTGDGGPATAATIGEVFGIAVDVSGNLYLSESRNYRIRKVSVDGTISTVAGGTSTASSGDGGPATSASLCGPYGLAVDAYGNLYIAERGSNRVRKMSAGGTISTVAGSGAYGYSGDGGPATSAALDSIEFVALDAAGNLYISDYNNGCVRKVSAGGTISTVAGSPSGTTGDGWPATTAKLFAPAGLAVDSSGNLYVGSPQKIRAVASGTSNPRPDYVSKTAVFRAGLWVGDSREIDHRSPLIPITILQ